MIYRVIVIILIALVPFAWYYQWNYGTEFNGLKEFLEGKTSLEFSHWIAIGLIGISVVGYLIIVLTPLSERIYFDEIEFIRWCSIIVVLLAGFYLYWDIGLFPKPNDIPLADEQIIQAHKPPEEPNKESKLWIAELVVLVLVLGAVVLYWKDKFWQFRRKEDAIYLSFWWWIRTNQYNRIKVWQAIGIWKQMGWEKYFCKFENNNGLVEEKALDLAQEYFYEITPSLKRRFINSPFIYSLHRFLYCTIPFLSDWKIVEPKILEPFRKKEIIFRFSEKLQTFQFKNKKGPWFTISFSDKHNDMVKYCLDNLKRFGIED